MNRKTLARLSPIPPIILDPRSETDLVSAAIARTIEASNGVITKIDPATVESALIEGCAFTAAQLLVYLNLAPEAWTVQFLSQVVGVGIQLDSQAVTAVQFNRSSSYANTTYTVPKGTQIANADQTKIFATTEDLPFLIGEISGTVTAVAIESGSAYNITTEDSAVLLSPIAQISSVSFIVDSFAGEDAETFGEVKARAYELLHRRSPISITDWVEFTQNFFGIDSKVIVTRGTSAGKRYYLDEVNTTVTYDSSLTELLQLMSQVGYTPTQADQGRFEAILRESSQTNDSLYISVSNAKNGDYSINILSSFINVARLYAQAGQQVYCNNCTKQYVTLSLIFDQNTLFDEDQVAFTTRNLIDSYLNDLAPGTPLNYNTIFSILVQVTKAKYMMMSTSSISNFGLNESQIEVENFRYFLRTIVTSNGSFTYYENRGETVYYLVPDAVTPYNLIEFNSSIDLIPQLPNIVWKIEDVFAMTEQQNVPGKLLRCYSDGSSLRLDENGEPITVNIDYGCLPYANA